MALQAIPRLCPDSVARKIFSSFSSCGRGGGKREFYKLLVGIMFWVMQDVARGISCTFPAFGTVLDFCQTVPVAQIQIASNYTAYLNIIISFACILRANESCGMHPYPYPSLANLYRLQCGGFMLVIFIIFSLKLYYI